MNLRFIFVLIPGCCLVFPLHSGAQTIPADTAFSRQALAALEQLYKKETAENLHLYNGTEYLPRGHGIKGFPFFSAPGLLNGSVLYDGNLYSDVAMQYDLEEDNLVINDYSGHLSLRLVKNKVRWFTLGGHRFVYLTEGRGLPVTGFYENLYSGKAGAWARRQKKVLSLDASGSDASYRSYDDYFIERAGTWFVIDNERALLAALSDKKDLLKKFIRSNKLRFKKDPEAFVARTAEYYTELKD